MTRALIKFDVDDSGAMFAFDADTGRPVQADFETYVDEFGGEKTRATVSFDIPQGARNRAQRRRAAARNRRGS